MQQLFFAYIVQFNFKPLSAKPSEVLKMSEYIFSLFSFSYYKMMNCLSYELNVWIVPSQLGYFCRMTLDGAFYYRFTRFLAGKVGGAVYEELLPLLATPYNALWIH